MTITNRTTPTHDAALPPVPRGWRVAHDFCYVLGGAERVSALLAREGAVDGPVVALGGRPEVFHDAGVESVEIRYPRTFGERHYRQLSLAVPMLSRFARPVEGNLLASSYAFSHHLRATGRTVVYCHSPLRQVWSGADMYVDHVPGPARRAARLAIGRLRDADRRAAHRAAAYVANSAAVADRIRRYYGIEPAAVVHPPVDAHFRRYDLPREDHYVWAGRIVEPYKRLGAVLEAFRAHPGRRLVVVGDGRDAPRLRATAPPNVRFVGPLGTAEVARAYATARAVIFPSEDDFGLVPVEAMACGTPVVALGRGGALETVVDGVTGVLFGEPTPAALNRALARFEAAAWDEGAIARYAEESFGRPHFIRVMRDVLASV